MFTIGSKWVFCRNLFRKILYPYIIVYRYVRWTKYFIQMQKYIWYSMQIFICTVSHMHRGILSSKVLGTEPKMEGFLYLIRLFWGGSPYISRIHTAYNRWGFLHLRYLKCLVILGSWKVLPWGGQSSGSPSTWLGRYWHGAGMLSICWGIWSTEMSWRSRSQGDLKSFRWIYKLIILERYHPCSLIEGMGPCRKDTDSCRNLEVCEICSFTYCICSTSYLDISILTWLYDMQDVFSCIWIDWDFGSKHWLLIPSPLHGNFSAHQDGCHAVAHEQSGCGSDAYS